MSEPPLVSVNGVSKKFCRSLKRSLWYGAQDIAYDLVGLSNQPERLRPEEFWAVRDVSFDLRRGECIGLLGVNGAGKSTLLKMLNGLIRPDAGEIHIRGKVGALIELGAGFNPLLSGRENVYVNGAVLGLRRREIDAQFERIVDFSGLESFIDSPVQSYSTGMRARLGFAVAAHLRCDLLLIDEVLAVGDVPFRWKCFQHLRRLIAEGTSIIVVTHSPMELSRVAVRSLVMKHGAALFDGALTEGVTRYQSLMTQRAADSSSSRSGPRIASVAIEDERGDERGDFQTGESVCARILLESDTTVTASRLIAGIDSPLLGPLGQMATPATNFEFDIVPPATEVRLILPKIPLLVGHYHLTLDLYGPDVGRFLDQRIPAACFNIVGPATDTQGFGFNHTFRFSHRWEHGLAAGGGESRVAATSDG
jgi:lipopolysaccharide transport system ATP-binding protein